jgi:transcription elongation factor GreA
MTYTLVAESEADLKTGKFPLPLKERFTAISRGIAEITVPNGVLKFNFEISRD